MATQGKAKKAPAKKAVVTKAPAKKAAPKKAPATKVAAKKAPATKVAVKKAPAKKAVAKKAPVKKAAVQKAPVKKAPAKKAPIKKAAVKKVAVKQAPAKKAPAKKAPVKAAVKAPAKAAPAKKAAAPKTAPKEAAAKVVADKPASTKKVAAPPPVVELKAWAKQAPSGLKPKSRKKPKKLVPLNPAAERPAPAVYVVGANESPWTAAEMKDVKAELQREAKRLVIEIAQQQEEIAELIADSGDGAGDDQADAGTKTFEREHEMALANNARDLLEQVENALERIAKKSYGKCSICSNPIGKERLKFRPYATLCMPCKQREERR
ncbi:MAG: TraR/DksA C4-type zinc finger protein [Actinobacteria bacterium]|nr:TraR/DksA C4-type zinc finger protein [Actinomycetota bacterium]